MEALATDSIFMLFVLQALHSWPLAFVIATIAALRALKRRH